MPRRRGTADPNQPTPDHTDRAAEAAGCYYEPTAAQYAVDFFARFLRHSKGEWAGKPFELEPWQQNYVRRLYGWKRSDGTRRYREAYVELPKKNGKSTTASGQSLYHLVADGEPGAEVYCAAVDRKQAGIVYNEAAAMVRKAPALAARLQVIKSAKRVAYPAAESFLQALSADAYSQEGLNASYCNVDELHAHKDRTLFDTLRYAGAARRQPLLTSITTAGYDRQSVCYQTRTYAEQVISGAIVDHSFLGIIYAADPDDDIEDPAVWAKANPSLGVTLRADDFAADLKRALQTPGALAAWKRYRLNLWTGSDTAWIERHAWDACGLEAIDPAALDGCESHAGLDLASTRDLAAFVEVFGNPAGGIIAIPHFWLPADTAEERQRRDRVPYLEWAAAGLVTLTPGNAIDYDQVEADILAIHRRRPIRRLYADPWNAAGTVSRLRAGGLADIAYIRQGFASLTGPTKELERLILTRRLLHGGHPVLRWNADNVVIEQDSSENIRPSKAKSREKIDGITALLCGLASVMDAAATPEPEPSPYQHRGVIDLDAA